MKIETFKDVQLQVRDTVKDRIDDDVAKLKKKITKYYLEHHDTDWLNMFEAWLYETQNDIAKYMSLFYHDAWRIVNLARFAWTEEQRQYYWDATALVEPDDQDDLDDLITKLSHSIVDAIARNEIDKQLRPFVSKVIETLDTERQTA